jgi:hypothetical protein
MDKGTTGVSGSEPTPEPAASIEKEIEDIRENLGGLVGELEHRGQQLNPLRAARIHPIIFALTSVAIAGLVSSGVYLYLLRRSQRVSWLGRFKRLRSSMHELIRRDQPLPPSAGKRIVHAAVSASAAVIARHLATRLLLPRT